MEPGSMKQRPGAADPDHGQEPQPFICQISSRVVYRNRWMTVREDEIERPDGSRGVYGVVDKPDFGIVIPAEDGGFHLVQEFRYPIGQRTWSFPQGSLPGLRDADPEHLARTELAEETGLRAGRLEHLGFLHGAHGMSGQGFHAWLATDLVRGEPSREHEEQDMRCRWVSRREFERMIRDRLVTDDATVAAYALLMLRQP
jgi:8-oxo-dGTP pyrophosphatase MutT (NUDIX family)